MHVLRIFVTEKWSPAVMPSARWSNDATRLSISIRLGFNQITDTVDLAVVSAQRRCSIDNLLAVGLGLLPDLNSVSASRPGPKVHSQCQSALRSVN